MDIIRLMPGSFDRYSTVPRYIQLAEELRSQIEAGAMRPGEQLPSFLEMQRRHGVSQSLLERTYRLLEEEKLLVRLNGKGTYVAEPPRAESRGPRTHIIGISGESFDARWRSSYMASLYEGIFTEAENAGYDLLHVNKTSKNNWEKVDGLLTAWGRYSTLNVGIPIMPRVSVLTVNEGVTGVTIDHYHGSRETMEHLLALGHRRIARVFKASEAVPQPHDGDMQRLLAYNDALQAAGLETDERWHRRMPDGSWNEDDFLHHGYKMMKAWLDDTSQHGWRSLGCTALLAQNDASAIGAIKALQEAGLKVPEDVSVAGFDGQSFGKFLTCQLTTVEVPLQEIGRRAVALLLEKINDPNLSADAPAHHEVLPTRFRAGQTTGPAPE